MKITIFVVISKTPYMILPPPPITHPPKKMILKVSEDIQKNYNKTTVGKQWQRYDF